jgi:intraflagellar transport protein 140
MAARDVAGRHPISHYWDLTEPKLLVCEAKLIPKDKTQKDQKDDYNKSISLTKATMVESVSVLCDYSECGSIG